MKKITVDFQSITFEVIEGIAKKYPQGFIESDVVRFGHTNLGMEDSVELVLNDTLYLIEKSVAEEVIALRYEEGYFAAVQNDKEQQDLDL